MEHWSGEGMGSEILVTGRVRSVCERSGEMRDGKGFAVLNLLAIMCLCAVLGIAVGCGGGGGGGGGGAAAVDDGAGEAGDEAGGGDVEDGVSFLNGVVSYVSASAKPVRVVGKPGGSAIYRFPEAPSGEFAGVSNAVVQLFTIDDITYAEPIAQTTTDTEGGYEFTSADFLEDYSYADYEDKTLVVRAMFRSTVSEDYVAINQLVDMEEVNAEEEAGGTYSANVDPFTNAVVQKIVNVFAELGLDLNQNQYETLKTLVDAVLQTARAEIESTGTAFTLNEDALRVDAEVYESAAVGNNIADTTDRAGAADGIQSDVIDGAVSGLETEMGDDVDLTVSENRVLVTRKFINYLVNLGFPVEDESESGRIYCGVPEYMDLPDGRTLNVADTLALAGIGISRAVRDGNGDGTIDTDEGKAFSRKILSVDLDAAFALDPQVEADLQAGWIDSREVRLIDLAAISGDESSQGGPPMYHNPDLANAVKVLWEYLEDCKTALPYRVVNELAVNRINERAALEEIAQVISQYFQWYTEDVVTINGFPEYQGSRPLDVNKGDAHGPTVKASTVLAELVGTIPESPYDYAVSIASKDTNIFDMAEDAMMEIMFKEFQASEATQTPFDPYQAMYRHITSFADMKNIVLGNYDLVPGLQITEKSDVYRREVDRTKTVLVSALPAEWFGTTLTRDTEVGFKAAVLMIIKVLDQDYVLDKTIEPSPYVRTVEHLDPSGAPIDEDGDGEVDVHVEPRWDNFKWMEPAEDLAADAVFSAAEAGGFDPVAAALFTRFFDGLNADGTVPVDPAGGEVSPLADMLGTLLADCSLNLQALNRVREFHFWFQDDFKGGGDMHEMAGEAPRMTAHVKFGVLDHDGSVPELSAVKIYKNLMTQDGTWEEQYVGYGSSSEFDKNGDGTSDVLVVTAEGLDTECDYRFEFSIAGREDDPSIWIWVPQWLPPANPQDPQDSIGTLDMLMWGEPFFLWPEGGFMDFAWFGLMPDEHWMEPDGTRRDVGVRLSGFETGAMYVPVDEGCDLRLQGPVTSVYSSLTLGSGAAVITRTDTEPNGPWGLDSLIGINVLDPNGDGDDTDSCFNGTTVTSIDIAPDNFDWGSGQSQYGGYLLAITDVEGRRFVVELCWMDPYDGRLDCRFAKVNRETGKLEVPAGGGFSNVPYIWLCPADYYSFETGMWSPPAFTPEGANSEAVAAADVRFNGSFVPTYQQPDPTGQVLNAHNNAFILDVTAGVTAREPAWDGANRPAMTDLEALFTEGAPQDASGAGINLYPGQYILIKSSNSAQYYLAAVGQADPWGAGMAYCGDWDGDGILDSWPETAEFVTTPEAPFTACGWNQLYLGDSFDFETGFISDGTGMGDDIRYADLLGEKMLEAFSENGIRTEWWTVWQDVDPCSISPAQTTGHQATLNAYYSLVTSEGSAIALRVANLANDMSWIEIEWRLYGGGPDMGGPPSGGEEFAIAQYFPMNPGRSLSYTDSIENLVTGESSTGTREWTFGVEPAALPDGRQSTAISEVIRDDTGAETATNERYMSYDPMGNLLDSGGTFSGTTALYSPAPILSWGYGRIGDYVYNYAEERTYDEAGNDTGGSSYVDVMCDMMRKESITLSGGAVYDDCVVMRVERNWMSGDRWEESYLWFANGAGIVRMEVYLWSGHELQPGLIQYEESRTITELDQVLNEGTPAPPMP